MNDLDGILELLIDGEWHRVDDLSARLGMPEPTLTTLIDFLSEHGFVQYDGRDGLVKIDPQFNNLMDD